MGWFRYSSQKGSVPFCYIRASNLGEWAGIGVTLPYRTDPSLKGSFGSDGNAPDCQRRQLWAGPRAASQVVYWPGDNGRLRSHVFASSSSMESFVCRGVWGNGVGLGMVSEGSLCACPPHGACP